MKETHYERYLDIRMKLDRFRVDNPISHIEAMSMLKDQQLIAHELLKQAYLDWREGKISDSIEITGDSGVIYRGEKK